MATGRRSGRRSARRSMNGIAISRISSDRRDADRPEDDRLRPLEDPQQVEEEVEVPVRARDEADRARVGRGVVELAEPPRRGARVVARNRPLPDDREPDDHDHDDERHDRVVEHRVGVERLPARLDVLLVLLEDAPPLDDAIAQPSTAPRPFVGAAPRGAGRIRPSRSGAGGGTTGPLPAASFDHGGEVTPSRITR